MLIVLVRPGAIFAKLSPLAQGSVVADVGVVAVVAVVAVVGVVAVVTVVDVVAVVAVLMHAWQFSFLCLQQQLQSILQPIAILGPMVFVDSSK